MFFKTLCFIFEVKQIKAYWSQCQCPPLAEEGQTQGSLWQGPVLAQELLRCKQPVRSLRGDFLHGLKCVVG